MNYRRKYLKLMQYAAILIVPVAILTFALQNTSETHLMNDSHLLAAQQIQPGGAKAILTLDDGETIYLDENLTEERLAGKQEPMPSIIRCRRIPCR